MARSDTVALTYTAEISDLRKTLASIPEITAAEARKSVRELNKSIRAVEREQKKANTAARRQASAMDAVATSSSGAARAAQSVALQLPDVASQLAAGTAPAQVFAQQGLQVVQSNMQMVTSAAGSMVSVLAGPLGVALAAGGILASEFALAYKDAARELQKTRDAINDVNQAMRPEIIEAAAAARRELNDLLADTRQLLLLESGELSALEVQQMAAVTAARENARAILLETGARYARLEVQRQELQAAVESGNLSTKDELAARNRLDALRTELPAARAKVDALKEELATKVENINATFNEVAAIREAAKARADAADATTSQADAVERLAEAQQRDRALRSEILQGINAEQQAREQLADLQAGMGQQGDEAEAIARANALYERRVETLDQIAAQIGYTQEVEQAFLDAQIENEEELAQIRKQFRQEREDAEREAAQQRIAQVQRETQQMRQSYAMLAGGIADAAGAAANLIANENKQAARALFGVQKAAAISEAIINGAIAKTQALAQLGPIFGSIAAAGITAATAAQVAVIASQQPSFNDTPGVMQLPSGGGLNLAPGDMVVAGKNLDDMADRVNRARGGSMAPRIEVVAIPSYEGRTYNRARRDAYRRPGPDYEAVNRNRANGPGGW